MKIYDPAYVRSISIKVYKASFSEDDRQRILADPNRGEDYFVNNAGSYDSLTRRYLRALDIEPTLDRKENKK